MCTYYPGSSGTVAIDYHPTKISRKALAAIGRQLRPNWHAVGITRHHQILCIHSLTGYWYTI